MGNTPFSEISRLCETLEKTKKRKEIAVLVGAFLKSLPLDDVPLAVNLILGRAIPGSRLDMSGAAIIEVLGNLIRTDEQEYASSFSETPDFGEGIRVLLEKTGFVRRGEKLTLEHVSRAFKEITETKGAGSRKKKREVLLRLLRRASPLEAKYIVKNIIGEMRHGVDEGMILEALSKTLGLDIGLLRRTMMLTGDIAETARKSFSQGFSGLKKVNLDIFRPIKPMLAERASSVSDAFAIMKSPFALEYKLDGARVQIHVKDKSCRLYSRNLTDITGSLPEIAEETTRAVKVKEAIVEGEVIAVGPDGGPLPFQVLMRRLGRVRDIEKLRRQIPVRLFLFDILLRDGQVFIDNPYEERWKALGQMSLPLVRRIIPVDKKEGERFFDQAIKEGYEGLMAKSLASLYTPGFRGKVWLKIKKVTSLDLVIIAADWGYGRRHGWLSNYHLAARDQKSGAYLPVGKTFKGLTDSEFKEMTERLLKLKTGEEGWTVSVKPEVVVEVLFSDVQKSPRYESGFALRFARIGRTREDKSPLEIDSLETVADIYRRQLAKPK